MSEIKHSTPQRNRGLVCCILQHAINDSRYWSTTLRLFCNRAHNIGSQRINVWRRKCWPSKKTALMDRHTYSSVNLSCFKLEIETIGTCVHCFSSHLQQLSYLLSRGLPHKCLSSSLWKAFYFLNTFGSSAWLLIIGKHRQHKLVTFMELKNM